MLDLILNFLRDLLRPQHVSQWCHLARRLPGARRQWEAVKIQTVTALEVVTQVRIGLIAVTLNGSETETFGWLQILGRLLLEGLLCKDLLPDSPRFRISQRPRLG